MPLPEQTKTFRDPVHGYIGVFDWEREIIDTAAFQRLRGIRQLGYRLMFTTVPNTPDLATPPE